eukprot:434664-Lingulodinium_polyedra.AAC.1
MDNAQYVTKFVCVAGANIEHSAQTSSRPLPRATASGKFEVAKWFLGDRADMGRPSSSGVTAVF